MKDLLDRPRKRRDVYKGSVDVESAAPAECDGGRGMEIGDENRSARTQKSSDLLCERGQVWQVACEEGANDHVG